MRLRSVGIPLLENCPLGYRLEVNGNAQKYKGLISPFWWGCVGR